MKRLILALSLLLLALLMQAQKTVVVADATTHLPVAYASLYSKDDGRFRSVISDVDGRATVAFNFKRLTVSHLNYETATLRHLSDTVLLQPCFRSTQEVVVTNREPEWIRRKLKEVIKHKALNYFSVDDTMRYSYHTQNMGTNNIYRYHSAGMIITKCPQRDHYAIVADSSHITASDSTRLTDTNNLRRILYEDFVMELDNSFISSHKWGENPDYKGRSADEVELFFRSKNRKDDRGRVVIDTARCVILQAVRTSELKTNCHERLSPVLYGMARLMSGYHIKAWTRDYRVSYACRPDGTLYPAEVRYKTYFDSVDGEQTKDQKEFSEQTGGGFTNMEATLTLQPADDTGGEREYTELPPSWYLRLSSSEARQRDVQLANQPATFTLF